MPSNTDWIANYVNSRRALVRFNGSGGVSKNGNALPYMTPTGLVAYLAYWVESMRPLFRDATYLGQLGIQTRDLPLDQFLGGKPSGDPLVRVLKNGSTFELVFNDETRTERCRRVVRAFDAGMTSISIALFPVPGFQRDAAGNASNALVEGVFDAAYDIASELSSARLAVTGAERWDAAREGAREGWKNVKETAKAVVHEAAAAAGEVAKGAAETAAAGATGFLSSLTDDIWGILLIAGAVVYWRYG